MCEIDLFVGEEEFQLDDAHLQILDEFQRLGRRRRRRIDAFGRRRGPGRFALRRFTRPRRQFFGRGECAGCAGRAGRGDGGSSGGELVLQLVDAQQDFHGIAAVAFEGFVAHPVRFGGFFETFLRSAGSNFC